MARGITTPYVCRVHDFFRFPDQADHTTGFLTMEFLEGVTLRTRITESGRLPWRDAQSIATELCQGLEAIHRAGVVHRDLKPENVMLAKRQGSIQAVIMDLGVAHADQTPEKHAAHHQDAAAVVGTSPYMAPEQFEGNPASPATDIYALGVVLYEMVTGESPFGAQSLLAAAVRRSKPRKPASALVPGIPKWWDGVIDQCLQYEPEKRFQSAHAVAASLGGLAYWRRHWMTCATAAILIVAFVAAGMDLYPLIYRHKVPIAARASYLEAVTLFRMSTFVTATNLLRDAVKIDPDFALARARLADASTELDLTGDATAQIVALKDGLIHELPPADRTYVEGVHDAVRLDFKSAILKYAELVRMASTIEDKAAAHFDLGRIQERAGEIDEAEKEYKAARQLAPWMPATYLRVGILEGRRGHNTEADKELAEAERLYEPRNLLRGSLR